MRSVQLYRQILKLHRSVLPSDLRSLGDAYVREEFRKHRNADASFMEHFYRAWDEYANTLEVQRAHGNVRGRDLPKEKEETLSESQRKQLALLRREATRGLKGEDRHHHHEHGHVHGPNCKH